MFLGIRGQDPVICRQTAKEGLRLFRLTFNEEDGFFHDFPLQVSFQSGNVVCINKKRNREGIFEEY
ncbi:MAG: hypothetical protein H6750_09595 [Nitrospiraceae bacterium]|nr:hypothetical protein [Nitrospiraceae bacterium]MCW5783832.1 hypothetical protein [Nitrospirales bacterium]